MVLQGVLFDMDGVLTSTDEYHYLSWQQIAGEVGLAFDRQIYTQLLGRARRPSLEILLAGRRLPEAELQAILERKNRYFLEYVHRMGPGDLKPGVTELLAELRNARLPIAVASSSANTRPVLTALGILDCFEAVVDSNHAARPKPAPDLFLAAAAALGVPPAGCLVIEDSQAGVQAARAAGARVLGLGDPARLAAADWVLPTLAGLNLKSLQAWFAS